MRSREPRPEEQIRPDKLVRVIKQEPVAGGIHEKLKDIDPTPGNFRRFKGDVRPVSKLSKLPKHIYWGIAGLVALFVIGFIVSFFVVKQKVHDSVAGQISALQKGVADLQNLDPQSASAQFSQLTSNTSPSLGDLINVFGALFAGGKNFASSFGDLTTQLSSLSQQINSLESGIFAFAANGQASNLVDVLTSTRNTL